MNSLTPLRSWQVLIRHERIERILNVLNGIGSLVVVSCTTSSVQRFWDGGA